MSRDADSRLFQTKRAWALVLACVIAAAVVFGSYRSTPAEWAPEISEIAEAARGDSAPADKVQFQVAADTTFAVFPATLLPARPPPTSFRFVQLESDRCRPGHRGRVDRPPRVHA